MSDFVLVSDIYTCCLLKKYCQYTVRATSIEPLLCVFQDQDGRFVLQIALFMFHNMCYNMMYTLHLLI